jgi:hypothetical protein
MEKEKRKYNMSNRRNAKDPNTFPRTIRMGIAEWDTLRKIAVDMDFHSAGAAARAGIQYWIKMKHPRYGKKFLKADSRLADNYPLFAQP